MHDYGQLLPGRAPCRTPWVSRRELCIQDYAHSPPHPPLKIDWHCLSVCPVMPKRSFIPKRNFIPKRKRSSIAAIPQSPFTVCLKIPYPPPSLTEEGFLFWHGCANAWRVDVECGPLSGERTHTAKRGRRVCGGRGLAPILRAILARGPGQPAKMKPSTTLTLPPFNTCLVCLVPL